MHCDHVLQTAERREDTVDGGGLALFLVLATAGGRGFEPAEEAGGDGLGPVIDLVGADILLEVIKE